MDAKIANFSEMKKDFMLNDGMMMLSYKGSKEMFT
jgi:hypothetical protein